MNRNFRILLVGLLGLGAAALPVACSSSGSNPGSYGDACTVYAVSAPCSGSLLCRCVLQGEEGCFCTQSCEGSSNCPNTEDSCLEADDPSQSEESPGLFCFQFLPDGGPLPQFPDGGS
jgi:hypothetical protein